MHPLEFTEKALEFRNHLNTLFSTGEKAIFWELLTKNTQAYLFGGIIKDFFLDKRLNHRDVDIVITQVNNGFFTAIEKYIVLKNRFGGLKLLVDDCIIDIWELEKTWAIVKEKVQKNEQVKTLPITSFFNITAITYSLKNSYFIYDKHFLEFIEGKMLDIVYEKNPFPELCIVKSYDFKKKFNLDLSKKLKKYIFRYYNERKNRLEKIQESHFGQVIYSLMELDEFYNSTILSELEVYDIEV